MYPDPLIAIDSVSRLVEAFYSELSYPERAPFATGADRHGRRCGRLPRGLQLVAPIQECLRDHGRGPADHRDPGCHRGER